MRGAPHFYGRANLGQGDFLKGTGSIGYRKEYVEKLARLPSGLVLVEAKHLHEVHFVAPLSGIECVRILSGSKIQGSASAHCRNLGQECR